MPDFTWMPWLAGLPGALFAAYWVARGWSISAEGLRHCEECAAKYPADPLWQERLAEWQERRTWQWPAMTLIVAALLLWRPVAWFIEVAISVWGTPCSTPGS